MLTTTLNRIREHKPCLAEWEKMLKYLGKTKADDEPLPYSVIVKVNGLINALWCCKVEPKYNKEWRLFAIWCAKQVWQDTNSLNALSVVEQYANGLASRSEVDNVRKFTEGSAWASCISCAGDAASDSAEISLNKNPALKDLITAKFLEVVG